MQSLLEDLWLYQKNQDSRALAEAEALLAAVTPLAAASLLVFCLLYTPCVAAVSSIKRELGAKWAVYIVIAQCIIAWLASFVVYSIGAAVL